MRAPAWLREVQAHPAVGALRADAARSLLAVVGVLATAARPDATSAPTWAVLMKRSELSRSTVARHLAWLGAHDLLTTLENGSTERFRPVPRHRRGRAAPVVVKGNRAAVYLLTTPLPPPEESDVDHQAAAVLMPGGVLEHFRRRALAALRAAGQGGLPRHETPPHLPFKGRWEKPPAQARATPQPRSTAGKNASKTWTAGGYRFQAERGTRGQQRAADLAVAEQLRTRSLDLRAISPTAIRSVIRPFLAAGWGVEDLIHAIDHTPDGTRRTYTSGPTTPPGPVTTPVDLHHHDQDGGERRRRGIRPETPAHPVTSPAAWLRWRLAPWAGQPSPVTAARRAALARQAAAQAAAAARRAEAAALAAAAVPAPAAFTAARQALAGSRWASSRRSTSTPGPHPRVEPVLGPQDSPADGPLTVSTVLRR